MNQFGKRLENLRRLKRLSRQEMARRLDLSLSTYRDMEYGASSHHLVRLLPQLAEIHGIDLHELLTGRPKRSASQLTAKLRQLRNITEEMLSLVEQESNFR